jgi:hypothetical protein
MASMLSTFGHAIRHPCSTGSDSTLHTDSSCSRTGLTRERDFANGLSVTPLYFIPGLISQIYPHTSHLAM